MNLPFTEAFEVLQSRDEHFEKITQETYAPGILRACLLYTSPSPRDRTRSRMPSSA